MSSGFKDPRSVTPPPAPRPSIAPPTDPGQVPQPSAVRGFFRFVWAHPWVSLLVGLVLGLAMGVIFGLPAEVARGCFVVGLVVIGLSRMIIYRWKAGAEPRAPVTTNAPGQNVPQGFRAQFGRGFSATLGFCFMALIFHWSTDSQRRAKLPRVRPVSNSSPIRLAVGSKNQQYWQNAVAALHLHRFQNPPDTNEGALRDWRRRLDQHRSAVAQARAQVSADVDPDLLAMAQWHFMTDDGYLKKQELLIKSTTDLALNPQALVDLERLSFDQLTERVFQAAQNGMLSQDVLEAWKSAAMAEEYAKVFFEIEVMQARLKERYKADNRLFQLPAISDNPPQSKIMPP